MLTLVYWHPSLAGIFSALWHIVAEIPTNLIFFVRFPSWTKKLLSGQNLLIWLLHVPTSIGWDHFTLTMLAFFHQIGVVLHQDTFWMPPAKYVVHTTNTFWSHPNSSELIQNGLNKKTFDSLFWIIDNYWSLLSKAFWTVFY